MMLAEKYDLITYNKEIAGILNNYFADITKGQKIFFIYYSN